MTLYVGLSRSKSALLAVISFVCGAAGDTTAIAQQSPNWDACSGRNVPTFEERINACTAIIESGSEVPADRAKALGFRGAAYANHGDNGAAIGDYEASLQLDATSSSGHRILGNRYLTEKNYDAALAEYDEAIRLDPTNALAFTNRGAAYSNKKEYDRAISEYSEAIRLDPGWLLSYYGRGMASSAKMEYDRAIADFDEAIRLNPRFALAFLGRGRVHRQKGEYTQAIAEDDGAIKADPSLAAAYAARCGDRIAAGQDLHAALSDCDESVRRQPRELLATTHRGFIHLKLANVTEAIADFDAVLSIDAKYALSLCGRGLARRQKGALSDAQTDISAAEKIQPGTIIFVTKYYGLATPPDLLSPFAVAQMQEQPMAFVLAHGSTDACGPGCNEWIAADGAFDRDVDKRFRDFLGTLKGRKLPIFFNSNGGFMNKAVVVGRMLRERGMAASLGITVPEDCRTEYPTDQSCRQILRTSQSVKAQLRTAGAICFSACAYAFIGAAVRQVPDGARLGVHAPLSAQPDAKSRSAVAAIEEQERALRRQYTKQMGVDTGLAELTDKTPYISLHVLTRDEITRFQIETPRH
jgi:tetratricopeptide (TPR) repeat protein